MAPRKKLPGVDKEALAGLAKQFPGSREPSSEDNQAAPEAGDEANQREAKARAEAAAAPPDPPRRGPKAKPAAQAKPKADPARRKSGGKTAALAAEAGGATTTTAADTTARAPKPTTPPAPPIPRRGGRVLVSLSLLISLFALALALAALSPPQLRSWLQARVDYPPLVDFLTGTGAGIEARLRDDAAAIQTAEDGLAAHAARLDAIEAVGGSNEAAARRVDAVEALAAASERIVRGLGPRVAAFAGRMDTAAGQDTDFDRRLAALEKQVPGRLTAIETGLGALRRSSSGPAKLYLIALRLRIAAQTPEPFADQVEAAARVGTEGGRIAAALQVLTRHAANGVATRVQLWDRFQRQLAPRLRGANCRWR